MRSLSLQGRDSGSLYGAYLAGRFAVAARDTDRAEAYYLDALKAEPGNAILLRRAFLLALANGDMGQAIDLAGAMGDEKSGIASLTLTAEEMRRGRYGAARRLLADADFGPFNATLAVLLDAWSFVDEGRYDMALERLAADERRDIFRGFHPLHRALILEASDQRRAADAAYVAASRSASAGQVRAAYGIFLERQGEDGRAPAEAHYRAILDIAPYDFGAQAGLRRVLDGDEAPEPFAADALAGGALAFFNMAAALAQDGGIETPLMYLQLALHLDPDMASAHIFQGELYESRELWDQAAAAFGRVKPASELYPAAQIALAVNLERLDEADRAIAILRKQGYANDSRPDPAISGAATAALLQLGDLLRAQDRFEEAVAVYDDALVQSEGQPASARWRTYFARGVAYERAKDWPSAEKDLKAALELSPEQPFVLNYLGYSWIDRGVNLTEGMELIERAVALQPNDGSIVDSLGWAHYRIGDYEEAVVHLERAAELTPGDPTIVDHLGDAYWRAGRRIEARHQWRRALTLEPEEETEALLRRKIELGLEPATGSGAGAKSGA